MIEFRSQCCQDAIDHNGFINRNPANIFVEYHSSNFDLRNAKCLSSSNICKPMNIPSYR